MPPVSARTLCFMTGGLCLAAGVLGWQVTRMGMALDPAKEVPQPKTGRFQTVTRTTGSPEGASPADKKRGGNRSQVQSSGARTPADAESPAQPPVRKNPAWSESPETAVAPPAFRPVPARAVAGGGVAAPVVLEFDAGARLPAILANPASVPGEGPAKTRAAAEAGIMEEFIAAATDSDGTFSGKNEGATPASNWDGATATADQQLRVLIGSAAYQQRSLDAARLRLQLQTQPAGGN